jgi:alkanesulfonate monooxygenase SsuD/methylene tetrahydromethanopterin reductase-like flavin-dependent oxidoreductase (luciferase family)
MSTPDLGVILPTMTPPGESPGDVGAAARHAEQLGFESVWVVDQLVAGTGTPFIESVVALSTAAAATQRVKLGFGVMILPLRQVAWVAKQVGSLQYVSSNRVILGVGAGGDRHELAWQAAGVPRSERGRRTDAALRVLRDLISGQATTLRDQPEQPTVQLSPAVPSPEVVVGGMSEAAMLRTIDYADGWYLLPALPDATRRYAAQLESLARQRDKPTPRLTGSIMLALPDDPALPDEAALLHRLTDVDGIFNMPPDIIPSVLLRSTPLELADLLRQYAAAGASRLVISVAAGDWRRQVELVAEARSLALRT